jgi:hypothetical protein
MLGDMADKPEDPYDVPAATVVLPAPDEAARQRAKPLFDRFVAQLREQPGSARGADWEPDAPAEAAPIAALFAGGRHYDLALSLLPQLPHGGSRCAAVPQDSDAPDARAAPAPARLGAAAAALAPALPSLPAGAARNPRTRPGLPAQYGGIRPSQDGLLPEPESLEAVESGDPMRRASVSLRSASAAAGDPALRGSMPSRAAETATPVNRVPVLLEGDETVGMQRASLPPLLPRPPPGAPALRAPVRSTVVVQPDAEALLSQTAETALLRTEDNGAMSFDVAFVDDVFVDLACTVSVHRGRATATFRVRDDNARRLLEAEAGRLRTGLEARGLKVTEVRVLRD